MGTADKDNNPIDLSFRPDTYWPKQETLELRVSRIKGEQRRLRAEALLRQRRIDELEALIDEGVLAENLSDEDREAWGRIHPSNLGGEFLPELEEGGVEIARVAIASTTGDVQSVRARRVGDGIAVRVVDEYGTEFSTGERMYQQPLTLGELIEFIDRSEAPGDMASGGLVLATIRAWFELETDEAERLLNAVSVSSAFYPDLAGYYERVVHDEVTELRDSDTDPPSG